MSVNNRVVDYDKLLKNINEMINLLEFDAMRSSGKAKLNSQHLHSLYYLAEIYEKKVEPPKPSIKPAEPKAAPAKKVTKKVASKAAE